MTMRAVFFDAVNEFHVGTAEIPQPGDGEVLLRVHSAGICGTDLHTLKGEYGRLPVIPGHEFSGEVIEVSHGVTELKPGDRVTVDPHGSSGGFEEYATAGVRYVHKIGDLTYDEAALIEPLACVVSGIETADVHLGDEVLVMGAGTIGLLFVQVARLCGAKSVAIADVFEEKLAKAKMLGADEVFVAGEDLKEQLMDAHPKGFHLTIDAAGNPKAQEQLPGFTRSRGKFLLFGVSYPGATMTIDPYDIFFRRLKIIGVHAFDAFDGMFDRAVGLARARHLNLADLVSHHFPLDEFPEALELMRGPEPSLKILMHPGGNP